MNRSRPMGRRPARVRSAALVAGMVVVGLLGGVALRGAWTSPAEPTAHVALMASTGTEAVTPVEPLPEPCAEAVVETLGQPAVEMETSGALAEIPVVETLGLPEVLEVIAAPQEMEIVGFPREETVALVLVEEVPMPTVEALVLAEEMPPPAVHEEVALVLFQAGGKPKLQALLENEKELRTEMGKLLGNAMFKNPGKEWFRQKDIPLSAESLKVQGGKVSWKVKVPATVTVTDQEVATNLRAIFSAFLESTESSADTNKKVLGEAEFGREETSSTPPITPPITPPVIPDASPCEPVIVVDPCPMPCATTCPPAPCVRTCTPAPRHRLFSRCR